MWSGRPVALCVAALLALTACEQEVFEHSRQLLSTADASLGGSDGAVASPAPDDPPENVCADAPDGTPCDDRDICTPGSVCRGGECFGENPFDTCVVADTMADFSTTQGQDGWWNGYWEAEADPDGSYDPQTDFKMMVFCMGNIWTPPGGCEHIDAAPVEWTRNLSHALQHPEVRPVLELPVRRWVSDVSGPARISIRHWVGDDVSDGTRAMLFIDGEEVWRNDDLPDDIESTAELTVELEEGMLVEQLVHPRGHQAGDMTHFSIVIEH